jgi:hypothetical protein
MRESSLLKVKTEVAKRGTGSERNWPNCQEKPRISLGACPPFCDAPKHTKNEDGPLKKGTVVHDAYITLNHEKGTGTAAPGLVCATFASSLSGGASPFFMAGTVPVLFLTDVT